MNRRGMLLFIVLDEGADGSPEKEIPNLFISIELSKNSEGNTDS